MTASRVARRLGTFSGALILACGALAKSPTQEESDRAGRIFLNVKEEIMVRCIYKPGDRKIAIGALKALAQELGPDFARYFPADPGPTFPSVWRAYQESLRRLAADARLKDRTYQDLVEQSLRGYCHSLDRFSDYDDLATWKREKPIGTMDYIGIGMTLERIAEGFDCYPFPDGPAALAGILAGDRLLDVDGEKVRGRTAVDVTAMIVGKAGTPVKLTVRHRTGGKVEAVTVRREAITSSFIDVVQNPGEAIVRLRRLTDSTVRDLRDFLRTLSSKDRLTLDLRGCHGGELDAAINIAELFLPAGVVIGKLETREGSEIFKSKNPSPYRPASFVILQDKGTASGAELLTVALAASPEVRAQTRGEQTFGKGLMILEIKVEGGGRLRIASGRLYGPNGEFWDGEGLNPEIEVASTPR